MNASDIVKALGDCDDTAGCPAQFQLSRAFENARPQFEHLSHVAARVIARLHEKRLSQRRDASRPSYPSRLTLTARRAGTYGELR